MHMTIHMHMNIHMHIHTTHTRIPPGDFNCTRGYEWMLIDEARKRNPAIRVWGLVWGTPGWVGGNSSSAGQKRFIFSYF